MKIMKTTIKVLSALVLTLCFFTVSAQYNSAAGVRFTDDALLGTYKINLNDRLSAEGFAGFSTSNRRNGLVVGAEFHLNTEMPDLENLRWFYGAGALLRIGDVGSGLFAYGTGGLDYSFEEIPLNLSLQANPGLLFGDIGGFEFDIALSARYILGY